jgi:hypothetical protein
VVAAATAAAAATRSPERFESTVTEGCFQTPLLLLELSVSAASATGNIRTAAVMCHAQVVEQVRSPCTANQGGGEDDPCNCTDQSRTVRGGEGEHQRKGHRAAQSTAPQHNPLRSINELRHAP